MLTIKNESLISGLLMLFGYRKVKILLSTERRIRHVLLHPDDLSYNEDIDDFEEAFVNHLLNNATKWFYDINPKYRFDIKNIQNQMTLVKSEPKFIRHILYPMPMVQLKAIRKYHNYIEYIDNPTEEAQWLAVTKNPQAISYINNPSEELQIAAITAEPNSIQGLKNPSSRAIALAVSLKPKTIRFLKEQMVNDNLLWEAIVYDPNYICYIVKPTEAMIEYAFDKVEKVSALQKCAYYGNVTVRVYLKFKYPHLMNGNILR